MKNFFYCVKNPKISYLYCCKNFDKNNSLKKRSIELKLYELYDHKDGVYTPDCYEIIENEPQQIKLIKQLN